MDEGFCHRFFVVVFFKSKYEFLIVFQFVSYVSLQNMVAHVGNSA